MTEFLKWELDGETGDGLPRWRVAVERDYYYAIENGRTTCFWGGKYRRPQWIYGDRRYAALSIMERCGLVGPLTAQIMRLELGNEQIQSSKG